ncbi:MAG: chemotaxis response regulator protein-glutamate methylesterase [Deltaproteobacteria bacterium]|nr:chemotaxis response regulator protein-glutamate methylesterase [Deltaproteobacteria bacterium]
MNEPLKILIVDDSRIFRSVIDKALEGDPNFRVIASVWNGVKALEAIGTERPDLVTLDVEMPEMDGLATLGKIMEINRKTPDIPEIGVIMVSSHTHQGAKITIQSLEEGAFDFLAKPEGANLDESLAKLKSELKSKLLAFSEKSGRKQKRSVIGPIDSPQASPAPRPPTSTRIKAVLIGVSTGGPRALTNILPEISELIHLPIFIVQHMPPVFTRSLADSLDKKCRHHVVEANDGDVVDENKIFIAPGNRHMVVRSIGDGKTTVGLNDQPPENGCRPAVDVMFRSAANVYGGDVVAVVLTGMGVDGTNGLAPLKRSGAHVIAQDEESSVVWGMPGSAVASGNVDMISPLDKIPKAIEKIILNSGRLS